MRTLLTTANCEPTWSYIVPMIEIYHWKQTKIPISFIYDISML